MEIAKIRVEETLAIVISRKAITAALTGATISVEYAPGVWDGLTKTVVFRGSKTKDVVSQNGIIHVPPETIALPGRHLEIGVYGIDADGLRIIPTIWCSLGLVLPGADPSGDTSTDPSLPVWGQIADRVETVAQDVEELKQAGGGSPGKPGDDCADGGYYTPSVSQPDPATVQFAFAPSNPNMPAVPPATITLPVPESGENVDLEGYATEQWVKDQKYLTEVPEGYAKDEDIPTNPEDIGAQPSGDYALKSEIPSVPVQSVNGKTGAVQLSAADVGADPKGTAADAVSSHNTSNNSHNDIRLELKAINDRLTAFFDSDDKALDELSEIVAYITSNKSLIDAITTSKVSVADIINNLTTNVTNKPLSAAQGIVLKGLIDGVSNSLANYQPKGNYVTKEDSEEWVFTLVDGSTVTKAVFVK